MEINPGPVVHEQEEPPHVPKPHGYVNVKIHKKWSVVVPNFSQRRSTGEDPYEVCVVQCYPHSSDF